ncbi:MAG: T9SS type A sorting domain-containing protein [Flavobacteriales bacterium]|nr:T9SS type A sorting domain-containing protein [Flavobacteriales bacterium]
MAHTFNSDLQITLTSPSGVTRNLVLNKFGNGDNLGNPAACPGTVLTLQDGGTTLTTANTSNVAGTFAPEQLLSGFTGDPNGAWTLNVCDNAGTDVGRVVYAQLNFCTLPQITATSTNSPVCSPAAVTLGVTATGSPAPTYLWAGTGTFAPNTTSANVSVTGAASGNYTITASSSCGTTNAIVPVVVNPQPVITCPGNSAACLNTPAFALTGGSPAGGAYSGTGVSAGTFDPAVAGVGAHTITYNYTDGNGCTNTPCTFQITVNALPVVTCPSNSAVCIDVPAFALTGGSPVGGTYSGTGVSGGNFDPAVAGAGAHTITYSYTDGNTCTNTCTYQITVNALPVVTCGGPYGPVCIDNGLVALSGSPVGGTWIGTGVSGTNFDPSVSGTGSFGLTYNYTDGNGCSSSCNTSITVNPLPVVTCPADAAACSADPAFALAGGSPAGGTYSGTGVSGGNFDPAIANTGANTITYSYTDGNGCSASCTFTITVTAATPWYEDADNDTYGDPGSMLMDCVQPSGYVADNTDDCPSLFGRNGDSCNDANPFTSGDVITACVCAGTPAPCDTWNLDITTDANGAEISWQVKDANSAFILASGAPVLNNNTVNSSFCVPQGACFELIMNDAGNNGFAGGGWVLTDNSGNRVIDNGGNGGAFTNTCTSTPESFCNPVGTDKLIASDCAREFYGANDNVFASANPAVSAEWPVSSNANLADDGYQFWFFNPSGGYSRRIFRNHATSGGFGPADAIRASKLALDNIQTNPLPLNTLLNVRVRSRVNGSNSAWGPACRLRIAVDPCPSTKLIDAPNHPNFSCGVQREFGGSDKVHCNPVAGANKYRFRFENADEGYLRNIATNTPTLVLNWVTLPLVNGGIYDVRVQASFDGGATYCPLGAACVVNILNVPAQSGRAMETTDVAALGTERPEVWPNPTADGSFDIRWTVPMEQEGTITLEILDMNGRTLHQERIAVADGILQAHINPQHALSGGVYLLRFTTGGTQHMERLVVR